MGEALNMTLCRYITMRSREATGVTAHKPYSRVITLIVESGALIAVAKFIEFVLFKLAPVDGLQGLNALYIVYESMPQITVRACPHERVHCVMLTMAYMCE